MNEDWFPTVSLSLAQLLSWIILRYSVIFASLKIINFTSQHLVSLASSKEVPKCCYVCSTSLISSKSCIMGRITWHEQQAPDLQGLMIFLNLKCEDQRSGVTWQNAALYFVWPGFGNRGLRGVASVRSCQMLPPCLAEPVSGSPKTNVLLDKAGAIRNVSSTSTRTFWRRRK